MRVVTLVFGMTVLLAGPARAQDPCASDPCKAGCADFCWFNSHETNPSAGVPVHWSPLPVKYKINAQRVTAGLTKADVIDAVKKAFQAWEGLKCSKLKFQYAGESPSFTEEAGHVLVYWDYDAKYKTGGTWIHGDNAYWVQGEWTDYAKGEISKGVIGLNSTPNHPQYKYDWSIGAEASKFDIQSLVTWLIPTAVGFYVGNDEAKGTIPLFYNKEYRTLCQSHKTAAAYNYFDSAGSGCTKPTAAYCTKGIIPKPDGGGPTEGGTPNKEAGGPGSEGGMAYEAGTGGDPGTLPPTEEDDGCCRVSHARGGSIPYLTLVGLLVLLAISRRRRRR